MADPTATADLIAFLQALPACAPAQMDYCDWYGSAGCTASQKPGGYENQWHWPRDIQVGEDAHRYSQRNGVQVLALLRTLALNLLRCNGFPFAQSVLA